MKTRNEKNIAALITILFIASVMLFAASITFIMLVQEFRTLDIRLTVGNHIGFNTDTDKLYFGTLPRGNTASRNIVIENKEYEKSVVRLKVYGEIKGWVAVSENNFILKQGESKKVVIEAIAPEDAELKSYDSRLIVVFTRL